LIVFINPHFLSDNDNDKTLEISGDASVDNGIIFKMAAKIVAKNLTETFNIGDSVEFRGIEGIKANSSAWTISEIYKDESSGFSKCIIYNRGEIKRNVDPMDLKKI
jgi:hypothetical protein